MALSTFSTFYYGHSVTTGNLNINFDEGSGELLAVVVVDSYSATAFAAAIQTALNSAGTYTYTVVFDRATRKITIASASGNFSLLAATGTEVATGLWVLMGFAATDLSAAATYTGDAVSGSVYSPQFKLQDHISTADWKAASSATVNKTASGRVEVIKFGDEEFMQANIKYATDIAQPDAIIIKNAASGLTNLRTFMQYAIEKKPIEYMADIDTPATFEKMLLESSPGFKNGTGYKLKELYGQGLPGYFETGSLVLRVIT